MGSKEKLLKRMKVLARDMRDTGLLLKSTYPNDANAIGRGAELINASTMVQEWVVYLSNRISL